MAFNEEGTRKNRTILHEALYNNNNNNNNNNRNY